MNRHIIKSLQGWSEHNVIAKFHKHGESVEILVFILAQRVWLLLDYRFTIAAK